MTTLADTPTNSSARPSSSPVNYQRLADIVATDLKQMPVRYQGVRLECAGLQPTDVDVLRDIVSKTLAAKLRPTQTVELGKRATYADLENEASRLGYNGNRLDPLWVIVLREMNETIVHPGSIFSTHPHATGPQAFRPELFYSVKVEEFLQYIR